MSSSVDFKVGQTSDRMFMLSFDSFIFLFGKSNYKHGTRALTWLYSPAKQTVLNQTNLSKALLNKLHSLIIALLIPQTIVTEHVFNFNQ